MTIQSAAAPRKAARVLLVDALDRLLLLHASLPDGQGIWLPPGGGIETGETPEAAAMREVREETGIVLDSPGRCVWTRRSTFDGLDQAEWFFLVRLAATPVVRLHANPDAVEALLTRGYQWWTHPEIVAASDTLFVPHTLGDHLGPLLAGVVPAEPFDVGI